VFTALQAVPIKPASCLAPQSRMASEEQAGPLDLIFNWDAGRSISKA
jgi:hypothetical protein